MKKNKTESVLKALSLIIAGLIIGVTANLNAQSWSNPTVPPPDGNVAAPLNTSGTAQTKTGGLVLNTPSGPYTGTLAIGKSSPAAGLKLDVNGSAIINTLGVINLVVATGSPATGKVLGALDSSGTVGWKTLDAVDLPAATTAALETVLIHRPCPHKIMISGSPDTVFTPTYPSIYGDAGGTAECNDSRLYGTSIDTQGLTAFCQSIGYTNFVSAGFGQYSSPGNNKVTKYEPGSSAVSKFRFFPANGSTNGSSNNRYAEDVVCQRIITVPVLSEFL